MNPSVQKIITKLGKEKVDLSLINDITIANQKAVQDYETSIKLVFQFLSDIDRAIIFAEKAVDLAKKTMIKVDKFDTIRKEIGVEPDAKMKKSMKSIYDIAEIGGKAHLKVLQKIKQSAKAAF
jgi:predicted HicB family RNase H-like nuclease